jgi:hypothetical protein
MHVTSGLTRRVSTQLAVVISVSTLLTAGQVQPASANPAVERPTNQREAAASIEDAISSRLDGSAWSAIRVAQGIQNLVDSGKSKGFASLRVLRDSGRVELLWKGEVPSAVQHLISRSDPSVDTLVLDSDFSASELEAEIRRLFTIPPAKLGATLVRAAPLPDASGLKLVVERSAEVSRVTSSLRGNAIPVTVVQGTAATTTPGRWDDSVPFFGGGAIESSQFRCSVAFAARDKLFNEYMFTAKHCGTNDTWWVPLQPGSRIVGNSDGGLSGMDIMLLSGETYFGRVFSGGPFGTESVPIGGDVTPVVGAVAITSGAFSGLDVWSDVTEVGAFENLPGLGVMGPGIWTENILGVASVGSGDSGGPLMGFDNATQKVLAMGVIAAIDTSRAGPCIGIQDPNRVCSARAFHMNIRASLTFYRSVHPGLVIRTST